MVKISIRAQEVGDESCNKMTKRELLASRFMEMMLRTGDAVKMDVIVSRKEPSKEETEKLREAWQQRFISSDERAIKRAVALADCILKELYPPEHEKE